jgi:hypothetical protein
MVSILMLSLPLYLRHFIHFTILLQLYLDVIIVLSIGDDVSRLVVPGILS